MFLPLRLILYICLDVKKNFIAESPKRIKGVSGFNCSLYLETAIINYNHARFLKMPDCPVQEQVTITLGSIDKVKV